MKTPEQHLERSLDILKKFYPWEYERSRNAKLTDPNGILAGRFPPTVRKPVARLPSGALILGIADAVVLNDPITGQGSNNAAKAARIYLKRILDNGNKPFDGAWMQQTFDDYWAYAQFVTGWTNAMLQPPPPHVINILVAAQSKPKVGKAFVNGFDDISRNLIRVWVKKFETGAFDEDARAADLLQEYEAKIAALERLVGRQALEIELLKGR